MEQQIPDLIIFAIFTIFVLKIMQFIEVIYYSEVNELITSYENMPEIDETELKMI